MLVTICSFQLFLTILLKIPAQRFGIPPSSAWLWPVRVLFLRGISGCVALKSDLLRRKKCLPTPQHSHRAGTQRVENQPPGRACYARCFCWCSIFQTVVNEETRQVNLNLIWLPKKSNPSLRLAILPV